MPTNPAFVLKRVEYGEADLIVTLLSRSAGLLSAIAKHARKSEKRFGGGLQPVQCLRASYNFKNNRDLAFLNDVSVVEDYPAIERDYDRITIASFATEITRESLVPLDPAADTFDLLRAFFSQLNGTDNSKTACLHRLGHFEYHLLALQGSPPTIDRCSRCGRTVKKFDKLRALRTGEGLVCGDCIRRDDTFGILALETFQLLHHYRQTDAVPEGFSNQAIKQAKRFLDSTLYHFLEKQVKSKTMLDQLYESE